MYCFVLATYVLVTAPPPSLDSCTVEVSVQSPSCRAVNDMLIEASYVIARLVSVLR